MEIPKSKHKLGYTSKELKKILDLFGISYIKFSKKFGVNTCAIHPKTKETLYYKCDIERTIKYCLENREPFEWEWD